MIPNYFEELIKDKKFDYSIKGYNQHQVDRYLKKMISYYRNVFTEKEELEKKILKYEQQDKYLRKVLLRVEETSEEVIGEALKDANKIKQQAKEEAEQIKQEAISAAQLIKMKTIKEREQHLQNLINSQKLYEEITKKFIGNLYYTVRSKFNSLQEDLLNELNDYTGSLEDTEMYLHSIEKVNKENINQDSLIEDWKFKEEELLVGCKIKNNITDSAGNVIVSGSTIVTPEVIELLIEKELYGELVIAIGEEDNECS